MTVNDRSATFGGVRNKHFFMENAIRTACLPKLVNQSVYQYLVTLRHIQAHDSIYLFISQSALFYQLIVGLKGIDALYHTK
jgi:hypothetical protein